MITMKDWMELVDYKITEGSDYLWSCYGPNAYSLSSWNGIHGAGGYSFDIVFSTKTQKVYEVSVCDYTNNRAYRMIAENKQDKHRKEAEALDVNLNEAWDDVEYVDLEIDEDFMEKATAIKNGQDYDTRVSIPLNIPNDELLKYMIMAHERGMTFNDFIEEALKYAIEEHKRNPEVSKASLENFMEERGLIKPEDC
jgi:hypothetical protein